MLGLNEHRCNKSLSDMLLFYLSLLTFHNNIPPVLHSYCSRDCRHGHCNITLVRRRSFKKKRSRGAMTIEDEALDRFSELIGALRF